MQQTSLESYHSIDSRELAVNQKLVIDCITALQPCSDGDVSRAIHMPRSLVAARRGELQKMSLVVPGVYCTDKYTGRKTMTWVTKKW
jgi:hypothetical protein